MTLLQILPLAAYAFTLIVVASIMFRKTAMSQGAWMFPAALSLSFGAFSLYTVLQEGPFGFWPNHSINLWGNQVWFDLLLSVGTAFVLLLPKARSLSIRVFPWAIFVFTTASIGLLAFMARILFLQERNSR